MIAGRLLSLVLLLLALPAAARDAPWLVVPPALADIARSFAGPSTRIDAKEDEDAILAYCLSLGAQAPDGLLTTRRLLDRERRQCQAEAIDPDPARQLGLAGLALEAAPFPLTRRQLWRALAPEVSVNGRLVANGTRHWHEIDPALPDRPIAVRLTAPHALIEALVMAPGCLGAPDYARLDRRRLCRGIRSDIPESPEPVILGPLAGGGQPIEGVSPTAVDLASGRYPLARRVYLYVKKPHIPGIAGLSDLLTREAPGLMPVPTP